MALTERYVTAAAAGGGDGAEGTPWTLSEALAAAVAADRVNIKKGDYAGRTTDTPTNDGTAVSPIVIRGYNSVIGDLDVATYNADGTLVTTNYPNIEYNQAAQLNATGATHIVWAHLKIGVAGTGFSGATMRVGFNCVVYQCYVTNPSTNAAAIAIQGTAGTGSFIVENCDVGLTGASGGVAAIQTVNALARIINNRIIDSQTVGIQASNDGPIIVDNVFFAAVVGPCIDYTPTGTGANWFIRGNTISGKAIGFRCADGAFTIANYYGDNHITDSTTAAFLSLRDATSQIAGFFSHNRFRDNVANIDGWDDWAEATSFGHVTTDTGGTETDYIDTTTNKLGLISTAAGFRKSSVTGRDIGALQHAEPILPAAGDVEADSGVFGYSDAPSTPSLTAAGGGRGMGLGL